MTAPRALIDAVKLASRRKFMSQSEYTKHAILENLERKGTITEHF